MAEQPPVEAGASTGPDLVSEEPTPPTQSAVPADGPGHDDHGGHGEEIHMPPNSYWPLVTSVGVALALLGVVSLDTVPFIIVIGVLILLLGVGGWIKDARKEYSELH